MAVTPPLPLLGAVALIIVYAALRVGSGSYNSGPLFWLETAILGAAVLLMRLAAGRPLKSRRFQKFTSRHAVFLALLAPLVIFLFLRVMAFYNVALAQATNGVE